MIAEYSRFLVPVVYLIPAAIAFYIWFCLREKARQTTETINYPKILGYLCLAEGVHNSYYCLATTVRIFDEGVYETMMLPVPWLFAQGVIAMAFSVFFFYFRRSAHFEIGDVGRVKELAEQFKELAHIDPLTELRNRRALDAALVREKIRSDRTQRPFVLMMLDLDNFKEYNDSHGHQMGDRLLTDIADHVKAHLRKAIDIPFRYGGDELFVIMPETNHQVAGTIGTRLKESIKELSHGDVTASVGIVEISPRSSLGPGEMVHRADIAMYEAKRAGGDQVACVGVYDERWLERAGGGAP